MKFTEFFNKNKNVVEASARKRIASSIPISEERDAFYSGNTFKKYDVVESAGVRYRVLEKCTNYFQLMSESGEICKKFARDMALSENKEFVSIEDFAVRLGDESLIKESRYAVLSGTADDIAILKRIKESMDTTYKSKDKLTVAKIIADAVGVSYDVVSAPDNLVNQAIKKALKDPMMMRNKEILHNMIKIAREVGIKVSPSVFDEIKESDETDNLETVRGSLIKPEAPASEPVSPEMLHGHSMNAGRSETHRHHLVRKLRGL